MVKGIATKPAGVGSDRIYLGKAKDFLDGARILIDKEKWNSSAVLSVHAVISACDAVCVNFMHLRYGGADHVQAVELLGQLPVDKLELEPKLKQAKRVLSLKNAAEYEDRIVKPGDAQEMLKNAERIVEWVESKIK